MEKEFNKLPLEMRSNILKYNPYMQRLNKPLRESTKRYFYEQYCDYPISKKEFVNYVNVFKPEQFAIFVKSDNYKVLLFNYDEERDQYEVDYYLLSVQASDVEEFIISYDYTQYQNDSFDNLMRTFAHNYKYEISYDVQLSINILKERSCDIVDPYYPYNYMKRQFIKEVSVHRHGSDLDQTYELITTLWYMIVSYNIWNRSNVEEELETIFFNLDNVIFDSLGHLLDEDNTEHMNVLNEQYDVNFDLISNHILTPLQ